MTFCLDCDAPLPMLALRCAKCTAWNVIRGVEMDLARAKWEDHGDEDLVEASEDDADDR